MKLFATLTILAIAPAVFAAETTLPVEYNGASRSANAGYSPSDKSFGGSPLRSLSGMVARAPFQDPEPTPTVWSAGVYWDFRTKQTSAVVLRNIGQIKRPFNLTCDFDVDAFAGSDVQGNAVAGIGIGKSFNVAQNVVFKLEAAFTGSLEQKLGFGGILTVTVRF